MKIFVGCSADDNVDENIKKETEKLCNYISNDNDLVFGCSSSGLMGIVYNKFKNNNRKVYGVCYEFYKDDLKGLELTDTKMVKTISDLNQSLIMMSDLIIFLPGAYGTFSELYTALELKRTSVYKGNIILLNTNNFFDNVIKQSEIMKNSRTTISNLTDICTIINSVYEINNILFEK